MNTKIFSKTGSYSGIGFALPANKMIEVASEIIKFGTKIDKIYFCPYHIEGVIKKFKKNSIMRKPNNGMYMKASKVWKIDKKKSFMIGDQKTDMEFAKKSKIKGYLFHTGNLYDFVKSNIAIE